MPTLGSEAGVREVLRLGLGLTDLELGFLRTLIRLYPIE